MAATFGDAGFIRIDGAFPRQLADSLSDLIWGVCERRFGYDRGDPSTWTVPFQGRALRDTATSPLFDDILTDRVADLVDDLLGERNWEWPAGWGGFLVTFPNASAWRLPSAGWHQDWTFQVDCEPVRFFKTFVFLNEVRPGGGGTLVVAGSHRLHGRFPTGRSLDEAGQPTKTELLYTECDWLRDLSHDGDEPARRKWFMEHEREVAGVDLRVVELTGQPGDIVAIHPWLIHNVAPNANVSPRFMLAQVFARRSTQVP